MKRTLALLLVFLALFSFCGCRITIGVPPETSAQSGQTSASQQTVITSAETTEPEAGLSGFPFWEVSYNGATLYLLGSIHIADGSLYPLPSALLNAYAKSDCIAVEADVLAYEQDTAAQTEAAMLLFYLDGTTVQSHISPELYESAKSVLVSAGLYSENYEYCRPAVWSSAIDGLTTDLCGYTSDNGVDIFFLNAAKADGKQIIEVESIALQYAMLASFSDALNEFTLSSSVQQYNDIETTKASYADLFSLYSGGDMAAFEAELFSEDGLDEADIPLNDEYLGYLLDDRNPGMCAKAMELLQSGKTCFYIVGAAHMLGENGIVAYFQNAGCSVTQR